MDFLLALASFFLRSPEDKDVIRLTRLLRAFLATPEAKEIVSAAGDLVSAMQAAPAVAPPNGTSPAPPPSAEPRSPQAALGDAIGDALKQL